MTSSDQHTANSQILIQLIIICSIFNYLQKKFNVLEMFNNNNTTTNRVVVNNLTTTEIHTIFNSKILIVFYITLFQHDFFLQINNF